MKWVHVTGRHRCQHCGELCLAAWLWFTEPGTWTRCYCESCVQVLTATEEGTQ